MSPDAGLDPELLLRAYAAGLFPMSEAADDPKLFWVDPERRGVFPLDALAVSRSLAKTMRSDRFTVLANRDFEATIDACAEPRADRQKTWINATIRKTYGELFKRGHVHTIEVYREDRLVGGLYGVSLGAAFFGESMFHRERDTSKIALLHLAARLLAGGFTLLDTQFVTPHLATLGAVEIPRRDYRRRLARALTHEGQFDARRALSGREALALIEGDKRYLTAGYLPPKSFTG